MHHCLTTCPEDGQIRPAVRTGVGFEALLPQWDRSPQTTLCPPSHQCSPLGIRASSHSWAQEVELQTSSSPTTHHGITARLGWKGLHSHQPHPCHGLAAPQLRLPRAHPRPGAPQLWAVPWPHRPLSKEFLPHIRPKSSFFNLKPSILVLSLLACVQSTFPPAHKPPSRTLTLQSKVSSEPPPG